MERDGSSDAVVTLLDGSDASRHAPRHTAEVAPRAGARLVVLAPATGPKPGTRRAGTEVGAATRAAALREAEHRFPKLRSEIDGDESAWPGAIEVRDGVADPALDLLERERCPTVVLPRGGPGFAMGLAGDHTREIRKRSPAPVPLPQQRAA